MKYKGRRLKRYFGFKRKDVINYSYCIEHILPNKIIGWIFTNDIKLSEIKLTAGNNIIAKTKINIQRDDVSQSVNCDGQHGFILNIPENIPPLHRNLNVQLIATTEKEYIYLKLEKKIDNYKGNFSNYLYGLLESDFLSAEGHFDGISYDDLIIGWAGKINSSTAISIWLQTNELEPIKLLCNQYRADKSLDFISNNYGFELYIEELPKTWIGKSVFCSFDKEGFYKLPQNGEIVIKPYEEESKVSIIKNTNKITKNQNNLFNLDSSRDELESYKKLFEDINTKLDLYEEAENIKKEKLSKYPFFLRYFIN